MIKQLFFLFVRCAAAVALLCSPILVHDAHRLYLMNKVGTEVVKLHNIDGSMGTGFYVVAPSGSTYILTNKHVCEPLKPGELIQVADRKAQRRIGRRVLEIDETADLCLIEGLPNHDGLEISDRPTAHQHVFSMGHAQGYELDFQEGYVKAYLDAGDELLYSTNLYIFPGSSGSPVFNNFGNVVGIISRYNPESKWGLVVDIEDVKKFISVY